MEIYELRRFYDDEELRSNWNHRLPYIAAGTLSLLLLGWMSAAALPDRFDRGLRFTLPRGRKHYS
jgi:hypothetical protein